MKNLFKGSVALLLFALSITIFQMSCKKDAIAVPTGGLTKEQILVEKTWKVDKLHHVINGAYSAYIDGGANTTVTAYQNLRFTFNADGTGVHVNEDGNTFSFTWVLSADQRSLTLNVSFAVPTTYTWDMVEIADNYLHASVNLVIAGNSGNIETFRLIQIP